VNTEVQKDTFTEVSGFFYSTPDCTSRTWVWKPLVWKSNASILCQALGPPQVWDWVVSYLKLLPPRKGSSRSAHSEELCTQVSVEEGGSCGMFRSQFHVYLSQLTEVICIFIMLSMYYLKTWSKLSGSRYVIPAQGIIRMPRGMYYACLRNCIPCPILAFGVRTTVTDSQVPTGQMLSVTQLLDFLSFSKSSLSAMLSRCIDTLLLPPGSSLAHCWPLSFPH
jgi:hypothetical protein